MRQTLQMTTPAPPTKPQLYEWVDRETGHFRLNFHPGQTRAWDSAKRYTFIIAGTQSGKTSWGPWWLWREIQRCGAGDYMAVTSTYDLFKLKMLPEMLTIFEDILGIGKYWTGDRVIELRDPETGQFWAQKSNDPMWGRIILRSANAKGGLESTSAKAAWLDEVGQDEFPLSAWEAILRRLSLSRGRILGTTTPYNLGWLKQEIYDPWKARDPDIEVIQFASTLNPAFSKAEFAERERKMQAWRFNMFYRGEFEQPASLIYGMYKDDYDGHLVAPFTIPPHWPVYVGGDPGGVNMALIRLAYDQDHDVYYAFHESLDGNKTTQEHVDTALAYDAFHKLRVVQYAIGQPAESQTRRDWQAAGIKKVVGPPFSDVENGIDRVAALFKTNRLFIFSNLKRVRAELGTYARPTDEQGTILPGIKHKNHYHMLDALRYAVVSLEKQSRFKAARGRVKRR